MAIFHFHVGIGSRSKSGSQWNDAVKAAAYISGSKLVNDRTGQTADFRGKDVTYAAEEILLPEHVRERHPEWSGREEFWNAVERKETSPHAQLYRSFDMALPVELDLDQQRSLAMGMAAFFQTQGMAVDYGIHDEGTGNPHVHILTAMRGFTDEGEWALKEQKVYALDRAGERIPVIDPKTGEQKTQIRKRQRQDGSTYELVTPVWKRETVARNEWNTPESLRAWRKKWEDLTNAALARAGCSETVDCRSLEDQGIDRIPQIHIGTRSWKVEEAMTSGKAIPYAVSDREMLLRILKFVQDVIDLIRKALLEIIPDAFGNKLEDLSGRCERATSSVERGIITRRTTNAVVRLQNDAADALDKGIAVLKTEMTRGACHDLDIREDGTDLKNRLEALRSAEEEMPRRRQHRRR